MLARPRAVTHKSLFSPLFSWSRPVNVQGTWGGISEKRVREKTSTTHLLCFRIPCMAIQVSLYLSFFYKDGHADAEHKEMLRGRWHKFLFSVSFSCESGLTFSHRVSGMLMHDPDSCKKKEKMETCVRYRLHFFSIFNFMFTTVSSLIIISFVKGGEHRNLNGIRNVMLFPSIYWAIISFL